MLTSQDDDERLIEAFENGADDFCQQTAASGCRRACCAGRRVIRPQAIQKRPGRDPPFCGRTGGD